MKILIDIGHPAHVHYFKNFIRIMQNKGHEFLITARDKEVSHQLLEQYRIPYISRGRGKTGSIGKVLYMLKADILLWRQAVKFKPDFFLSFVSPYAAQVATFLGKPHIALDDTEHATKARKFYLPFTKYVLTPLCFYKDLGPKQLRFHSYMELCYLHPNYFTPDEKVREFLQVPNGKPYVLLRFVSWGASHDVGHSGLNMTTKRAIINKLKEKYAVYISAEGDVPVDMKEYCIKIPVHKMHDAMAFATLFIGEGGTMASECAMLGTPAVYVNSLNMGYLKEEEERGLIYGFRNSEGVLEKVCELLADNELHINTMTKRNKMLSEMIDPTQVLVDFFMTYPESVNNMKSDISNKLN